MTGRSARERTDMWPAWILACGLLLLGVPGQIQAQTGGGLSFLKIGTDAAALAMGEAYVSQSHGAYATYWNPAGLAAPGQNEGGLSHHLWIQDVRTYAGAARFGFGASGAVGVAVTATSAGAFEARERPGEPDGVFEAQFLSAGVSYGRQLGFLRLGVTLKYLTERIFVESANGYGFDVGAQVLLLNNDMTLGAVVQHMGSMDELGIQTTPLPRTVRIGGAVRPFRILADFDGFPLLNTTLAAEVTHRPDEDQDLFGTGQTQFRAGAEGEILETILLRAGYISNDALRRFSAGLGFGWRSFYFDYAFLPFREGFGTAAHIVTLKYSWD